MRPIYSYKDYRTALRDLIFSRRALDRSWTYGHIADQTKIQKSYISNVLNHRTHFNQDQLFRVSKVLELEEQRIEYLSLLLEMAKCTDKGRMKYLARQAKRLQTLESNQHQSLGAKNVDVSKKLLAEYYANPYCPIIHVLLSIPEYCDAPKKILDRLAISKRDFVRSIEILEECKLIKRDGDGFVKVDEQIHLSRERFLSTMHGLNFRMLALERLRTDRDGTNEFLTMSFSADREAAEKIKQVWVKTLAEISRIVADAPPADVFHINFDLFRV